MRKIYFTFLLAISSLSYGQFSENFDTAASMPAGWATYRGSNGLGTAFDWTFIATPRNFSAPNSAFVRYEANTGGTNEDWMVTPLIDLTSYTGVNLTFYGGQQYTAAYGTTYEVLVSTTSQTDIASFTPVMMYGESDFISTGAAPFTAADLKTVDLSAYDGQQIYVAFKMSQDDGDNWFIDNVDVTGTLSNVDFESTINNIYPNPTTGIVTIQHNETLESVKVIGLLGNVVKTFSNTSTIDLSDLNSGTYLLNIITESGKTTTRKVVKQ
ncbi:T9SS-dependent choice-of-anchor J family protein [Flavobacterium sp.]|uniref:T9SS-dependent choice-of-anchor J family protein n=1 Tax=Flavobacterium sp. TaxID=239 RepID=UPI002B4B24C0|nr:choice-of-anchor J domain-containing protein [Flavobacterium sp.]HLP65612.1 choice-of-anchor J domain-containing protein [Flavobacterium sp.]